MERKVHIEVTGKIHSILQWNNEVHITIKISNGLVKIKIPRAYCNPKKLYVDDVVKVMGKINDYRTDDKEYLYSATISVGSVSKKLGKNKPINHNLDFCDTFSFIGNIVSIYECDSEFCKIKFQEANDNTNIHSIYILKEELQKTMNVFDFRRLIHISGKVSFVVNHTLFMNESVSKIEYYASQMQFI